MSYFKKLEKEILSAINNAGYELENFSLLRSNRKDLGDYQINEAMSLAKKYKMNPHQIAENIVKELKKNSHLKDIAIAGPGFINFRLTDEFLIEFANSLVDDIKSNVDKHDKRKKYILDYGGANVAKTLHVGHLRPANIGEALKRLLILLGNDVIGDVHFGDSGLQVGQVILEMKERYPELPCFKDDYNGEDFDLPIDARDLDEIYPTASKKSKENEAFREEAARITLGIQKREGALFKLWEKIMKISVEDISNAYKYLNCTFDLFEGELDSFNYMEDMDKDLVSKGLLEDSEGAKIVRVAKEDDKKELPPFLVYKSNGAALYGTTDLATIYGRVKRFNPDAIWYVVDKRQDMHFELLFRVVHKAHLKDNLELEFQGFGTMNGEDGKPFKTRTGGVVTLRSLIAMVKEIVKAKLKDNIPEEEKDKIADQITIAAVKFADLSPYRVTDYIFNPEKFADVEGKTGPYILYAVTRMNSLINKTGDYDKKITSIDSETERNIFLTLLEMPNSINKAYKMRSLNEICDYLYNLASQFNTLYGETHILNEENKAKRDSLITLIAIIKEALVLLLDVLAIEVPAKM